MKNTFVVSVPFTGLGLYGGFRGNRWLRNRIKIFKQFVIPSLENQTDKDFVLWVAWREEERTNKYVLGLESWLSHFTDLKFKFTYHGIPIYDDKYNDKEAQERLFSAIQYSAPELLDLIGECDEVYWLLQPSDDLYHKDTIKNIKESFKDKEIQAVSYIAGYLCNYHTKQVLEYDPNTNPPFCAMKFTREQFIDPKKFIEHIGLKEDTPLYKKGTPYPSHEYLPMCLNTKYLNYRGFLVGTHGENISTHFNHPFGGKEVYNVLSNFGIENVEPIHLPKSLRKWIIRRLPYKWQKKFRYLFGEKLFNRFYNFIRS